MSGINIKIGTISTKFHYPYEGIFGKASPGPEYIIKEVTGNGYINLTNAVANHLMELKAYGGTEQRNLLLSGYTEVEYVDMPAGSYITMDNFPIYAGYKVEFDFQTTTLGSSLNNYLGGRPADSTAGNGFRLTKLSASSSNNNRVCMYGFESGTEFYDPTNKFTANTRYKFTYNNGVCTLESGGAVVSTNTFTVTDTSGVPRCINNYMNVTPSGASYSGRIYVYSVKVQDDQGNLILNFVPVKYGDNVGLYDTVSNSFTGATAGTFTAGPDVGPTPTAPIDIVCNNGVLKVSKNMANVNDQTALVGYYISSQGVVSADIYNRIYQDYIPVKPSTTYTLSMSSSVYYVTISEYSTAEDSGFIVRKAGVSGSNTSLTITTGATTNYVRFGANLNRTTKATMEKVLEIDWQLERGDTPTPYHEYVEGGIYTDGTTETIWSHGKNLFDKSTALLGDIATNGDYTSRTYRVVSDYIPVRYEQTFVGSGTLYDTNGDDYSANVIKAFYKADKSYITGSRGSVTGNKFTIDDNECAYIRIVFFNTSLVAGKTASVENSVLQLEEGATATTYEPYYNGGKATAEMLLKVGDYQDVQSIIDGVVTRNVGVLVLDGTEEYLNFNTQYNVAYFYIQDKKIGGTNFTPLLCSHLKLNNILYSNMNYGEIASTIKDTGINMRVSSDITSLALFKQWLADQYNAGTPVIVIYPLGTPTTETVVGQTMHIPDGDSTITITQASINNLGLYAKYKATE